MASHRAALVLICVCLAGASAEDVSCCSEKGFMPCGTGLGGQPRKVNEDGKDYCCPGSECVPAATVDVSCCGEKGLMPCGTGFEHQPVEETVDGKTYCCPTDICGSAPAPAPGSACCYAKGFMPCGTGLEGLPDEKSFNGAKYCCPSGHDGDVSSCAGNPPLKMIEATFDSNFPKISAAFNKLGEDIVALPGMKGFFKNCSRVEARTARFFGQAFAAIETDAEDDIRAFANEVLKDAQIVGDFGTCIGSVVDHFDPKPSCLLPKTGDGSNPTARCSSSGSATHFTASCAVPPLKASRSNSTKVLSTNNSAVTITTTANATLDFADNFAVEFDIIGERAMFTIPALTLSAGAGVALVGSTKVAPCAADPSKCKLVLNEGDTELYSEVVMAGYVPIAVLVTGEAYLKAIPELEGHMDASVSVALNPITLTNQVSVDLRRPKDALANLTDIIAIAGLEDKIKEALVVSVTGSIKASASLEVCAGVTLGVFFDGLNATMDIPVCVTAQLTASASASYSSSSGVATDDMSVDLSLTGNAIAIGLSLGIPSATALVQDACGMAQLSMAKTVASAADGWPTSSTQLAMGVIDRCAPGAVTCVENFTSAICTEVASQLSEIDLTFSHGSVPLMPEVVLWEKNVSSSNLGGSSAGGSSASSTPGPAPGSDNATAPTAPATACATPALYSGSTTYPGSSADNYLNYCLYMVTPDCLDMCSNAVLSGACKNECEQYSASSTPAPAPACATPALYSGSTTYPGSSADNYLNYCLYMVTPDCLDMCSNAVLSGACKNECEQYSYSYSTSAAPSQLSSTTTKSSMPVAAIVGVGCVVGVAGTVLGVIARHNNPAQGQEMTTDYELTDGTDYAEL